MSDIKLRFDGLSGNIYVYDDRITIDRNNKYAKTLKIPEKTCAISDLKGVSLTEAKTGFLTLENGWLKLDLPTNQTIQRGLFLTNNEIMDENKVFFKPEQNSAAKEFKKKLEDFMIQVKNSNTSSSSSSSSASSAADEILKLKSLLDSGILTQEEFDAKKKQLLGI